MFLLSYRIQLPPRKRDYTAGDYVRYLKSTLPVDKFQLADKTRDTLREISQDHTRTLNKDSCYVEFYCEDQEDCFSIKNTLSPILDEHLTIEWNKIKYVDVTKKELIFGI